jgi:sterol desaturase/sphingolipid hydroxylase (fatty acid hydroxylase superfamily)
MRDLVGPEWRPWLTGLLALLFGAALVEGLVLSRRTGRYDWRAFAVSIADVVGRRVTDAASGTLGLVFAVPLIEFVHGHRLTTIAMDSLWAFVLLFVGEEICYYAYHRCAHRVRWFWATHAVHHSPNELTLAAAMRLGWTGRISGTALFFAPLVWIGFSPIAVALAVAANLLYQFWLHTTWIPRLGRTFEWWFNTPSHHRVHHASNPEYLDCNYGGVLIVFDRWFGSFVEERADLPPRYGLTTPLVTCNPLRIAFHEWIALGRDLLRARHPQALAAALFAPPAGRAAKAAPRGCRRDGLLGGSALQRCTAGRRGQRDAQRTIR